MIITVKIDSEIIAQIRNDLQVILGSAEIMLKDPVWSPKRLEEIINRVHKIAKVLPK